MPSSRKASSSPPGVPGLLAAGLTAALLTLASAAPVSTASRDALVWELLDLSHADVAVLRRDAFLGDATCEATVRARLREHGAPASVLADLERSGRSLPGKPPPLRDVMALYRATLGALEVTPADAPRMVRCVRDAQCAWLVERVVRVCGDARAVAASAAVGERVATEVLTRDKLATWLARGVTSFLLAAPGDVEEAATTRRALSLLDGGDAADDDAADDDAAGQGAGAYAGAYGGGGGGGAGGRRGAGFGAVGDAMLAGGVAGGLGDALGASAGAAASALGSVTQALDVLRAAVPSAGGASTSSAAAAEAARVASSLDAIQRGVAVLAQGATAGGRRLGLWNPQAMPSASPFGAGNTNVREYVATLPTLHTPRERELAARALDKVEAAATQFATRVYLELPAEEKMTAMSAMQDPSAALPLVRYLLKRTRLSASVRRQLAFSPTEVGECLAYAAGDDARFDAVATALVRRKEGLSGDERAALIDVLRALKPATRSACMLVAWLDAQA